jgi:glutathione S-transferase
MLNLYYSPSTASMVPHIVLEELSVPYHRTLVDRANQAHKQPDYLRLNPNGRFPVLVDGDLVVYEAAAIVLHLCDTHPEAGLLPPVGSAARALAGQWLMWLTNTLQTTLMAYFYPERLLPHDWAATAGPAVQRQAEDNCMPLLAQLDAELARHGGDWFLPGGHSAVDAYVFTLCRWTRDFAHGQPARDWQHLGPYLRRMAQRPAVQRVLAHEGLLPPWV